MPETGAVREDYIMRKKILDIIYNTHTEGKEKLLFMKDFIPKHESSNYYEDMNDTVKFFYKHIPLHFAYEEVLINALLKSDKLNKDDISFVNRILEEHCEIRSKFEKIKEMAERNGKDPKKEMKEDFICLVHETIYTIIKHAELEDERLFPLAELKVDEAMLSEIKLGISKLVC